MGMSAPAAVGTALLGCALDADGTLLAGRRGRDAVRRTLELRVPAPPARAAVREPFWTGVRVLDGPLAFGRGARIGIFGAAGAGKSTLLETIVAGSAADATVIALVGERGREAERWLHRLGDRTTIVCATADRLPLERLRAAELAFAHACALRERGLHVLLVLDSLARLAAAARELALQAGEPAGRGGFPASVVGRQARFLECAGATPGGSITLIATVLTEGPQLDADPIAEAARAALDGHVVLSARLAAAGWFPAVDVPASASRTLADVADPDHQRAAAAVRAAIAALEATRDARTLGLESGRPDRVLAAALAAEGELEAYLRQGSAPASPAGTRTALLRLGARLILKPGAPDADRTT
jgi:type III secretion protein N (ATPase)